MTPETLSLAAGSLLSLALSWIPGLNVKYAALSSDTKRGIMFALLLVIAGLAYGASCLGWAEMVGLVPVTCDQAGLLVMVKAFFMALAANQATLSLAPQPQDVRELRGEG